jgi:hypothetical protein
MMATYNAGAGRGKQGGPTAKELSEYNYEDVLDERYRKKIKENKEYRAALRADTTDTNKLEKQMEVQQGGKVYMGDPYTKPASKEELAAFEKSSTDEEPDYPRMIIGAYGRAVDRGFDAALPLRKIGKMATLVNAANTSKKQYDDQVKAFEALPPDEQARKKIELKKQIPGGMAYKKGGKVSSASSRADGIAQRGMTKGRLV